MSPQPSNDVQTVSLSAYKRERLLHLRFRAKFKDERRDRLFWMRLSMGLGLAVFMLTAHSVWQSHQEKLDTSANASTAIQAYYPPMHRRSRGPSGVQILVDIA
jgi:hypothetical protein